MSSGRIHVPALPPQVVSAVQCFVPLMTDLLLAAIDQCSCAPVPPPCFSNRHCRRELLAGAPPMLAEAKAACRVYDIMVAVADEVRQTDCWLNGSVAAAAAGPAFVLFFQPPRLPLITSAPLPSTHGPLLLLHFLLLPQLARRLGATVGPTGAFMQRCLGMCSPASHGDSVASMRMRLMCPVPGEDADDGPVGTAFSADEGGLSGSAVISTHGDCSLLCGWMLLTSILGQGHQSAGLGRSFTLLITLMMGGA